LNPGSQRGRLDFKGSFAWKGLEIDYPKTRGDFIKFLESKKFNQRYIECMLSYLDRYVKVISGPMDVIKAFNNLTVGQQHNLSRGIRNLFNFLEAQGWSKDVLDVLRKNIPKDSTGLDLKIPSEEAILNSLKRLNRAPVKYQALYNLLLDSGLRLVEAIRLINTFKDAEEVNGFYRCELGYFRESKVAYYAHFTRCTLRLIREAEKNEDSLIEQNASHYFQKYDYVAPKYLRKFAFDKMIELEIPESVADFIQGRVAKKIGAKHYMALARQAGKYYPRYMEHITQLRSKAGLKVLS